MPPCHGVKKQQQKSELRHWEFGRVGGIKELRAGWLLVDFLCGYFEEGPFTLKGWFHQIQWSTEDIILQSKDTWGLVLSLCQFYSSYGLCAGYLGFQNEIEVIHYDTRHMDRHKIIQKGRGLHPIGIWWIFINFHQLNLTLFLFSTMHKIITMLKKNIGIN